MSVHVYQKLIFYGSLITLITFQGVCGKPVDFNESNLAVRSLLYGNIESFLDSDQENFSLKEEELCLALKSFIRISLSSSKFCNIPIVLEGLRQELERRIYPVKAGHWFDHKILEDVVIASLIAIGLTIGTYCMYQKYTIPRQKESAAFKEQCKQDGISVEKERTHSWIAHDTELITTTYWFDISSTSSKPSYDKNDDIELIMKKYMEFDMRSEIDEGTIILSILSLISYYYLMQKSYNLYLSKQGSYKHELATYEALLKYVLELQKRYPI